MSLTIQNIHYSPTPLDAISGEHEVFTFDVQQTPSDSPYMTIGASVIINDQNNVEVASVLGDFPSLPDLSFHVSLEWNGRDNNGNLLPPGDYAPTFIAQAGLEKVTATACSGITIKKKQDSTTDTCDSCYDGTDDESSHCSTSAPQPADPTALSNTMGGGNGFTLPTLNLPSLNLPTLNLPGLNLPTLNLPTFNPPTLDVASISQRDAVVPPFKPN